MSHCCDEYDIEISIDGPDQLKRLVAKLRAAVDSGVLRCNDFESSRALIGQVPFADLDLARQSPDVIRYYFDCADCGAPFGLFVETFHGSGGKWSRL